MKGVNKTWTPNKEMESNIILSSCKDFAERHLITSMVTVLKYDGRTRQSKIAWAKIRLNIAMATEEELMQLAELYAMLFSQPVEVELKKLHRIQAEVKEKGLKELQQLRSDSE